MEGDEEGHYGLSSKVKIKEFLNGDNSEKLKNSAIADLFPNCTGK